MAHFEVSNVILVNKQFVRLTFLGFSFKKKLERLLIANK